MCIKRKSVDIENGLIHLYVIRIYLMYYFINITFLVISLYGCGIIFHIKDVLNMEASEEEWVNYENNKNKVIG